MARTRLTQLPVLLCFAVLLVPLTSHAEEAEPTTVTEPLTAASFEIHRDFGGEPYVLIGVGSRRAGDMINIYGAGLYVGEKQGLAAWRERLPVLEKLGRTPEGEPDFDKIAHSAEARHFAVLDPFPRAIELAFVREVTAPQLSREFEDGWERAHLDRAAAGEALEQFMEALNHRGSRNQRLQIRTSVDYEIQVSRPDGESRIQGNRALVYALWRSWLGNPCLQTSLRDGLLSLLGNLHARQTGQ